MAQALLQDKLGYTVKTTKIDEYAQFPALANGQLDATLEVWPSGHAKDYKKFIDGNNGVVDGGQLGVTGQIGWWIPTYMLTDHPELATWEGLKTDADDVQDRGERERRADPGRRPELRHVRPADRRQPRA